MIILMLFSFTSQAQVISHVATNVETAGNTNVSEAGTVLNFRMEILNNGNVNLNPSSVTARMFPSLVATPLTGPIESLNNDGVFEVGERWTYTTTYTVTALDISTAAANFQHQFRYEFTETGATTFQANRAIQFSEDDYDEVTVTVKSNVAQPVGSDITECDSGQTLTASATPPAGASVVWFDAPAGGNIVASPTHSGVGSITFYAESQDASSGCNSELRTPITLTIYANPVADAGSTAELNCTTPQLNLDGSGSTAAGVSYAWTTVDGNIVSGANTVNPLINDAGTYTLTVTNTTTNCASTDTVVITEDFLAPIADAGSTAELTCAITSINLNASGSSGQGAITYAWTTSGTGNIVSGANTFNPVIDAPGTYTLTVTDADNGCTAIDTVVITEDISQPTVVVNGPLVIDCNNTTAALDGTGSATGANIEYAWTASAGGTLSGATNGISATGTTAGTYTLTVTNTDTGCSDSESITVTVDNTPPTVVVNGPLVIDCNNTTAALDGTGSATGANIEYAWTASAGGTLSGATNGISATGTTAGTYTLTVTNTDTGCSDSSDVTVTENNTAPTAVASGAGVLTCGVPTLTLNATTNAGSPTYLWTTVGGNIVSGATTANPVVDAAGTYSVTITNGDNGCSTTSNSVTVTGDTTCPTISIDDVTVVEGTDAFANFTVTLSAASDEDVTVTFTVDNGTAILTDDYTEPTLSITILAGNTTGTIAVGIVNDGISEPQEGFTVNITGAETNTTNTALTVSDAQGAGTINDDDSANITINDMSVNEADGTATFTVTLNNAVAGGFDVDYTTNPGTATGGGVDYNDNAGTLNFAGTAGETQTITVAINNDDLVEVTENYTVVLSNITGGLATIADASGLGTIIDNDSASISIDDVSVNEADGTATFTVTLNNAVAGGFDVDFTTTPGTATGGGVDYDNNSGTLTFAGTAAETQTITVDITNDALLEATENYTVVLSNITGGLATIADASGLGTIIDNDSASVTVEDVTVDEDAGTATFTITLNGDVAGGTTVDYSTANGTATAGSDYTNTTGTTAVLSIDGDTATFTVTITEDGLIENTETFTINLSASNALVEDTDTATGTIMDNDLPAAPSTTNITECVENPIQTLTATATPPAGSTIVWFDAATGGVEVANPILDAIGTITYYAESEDINTGKVSATRTAIVLTINALPEITNVSYTDPTTANCPTPNDGTITITATGSNLEYSIDGGATYQASNVFTGLTAGASPYTIAVRSTSTTCDVVDPTTVTLTDPGCNPSLIVTKTQTGGPATITAIGQTIEYTITLENNGDLDLTAIDIEDILPNGNVGVLVGPAGDNGTANVIDKGETWTYTISYTTSLADFQLGTNSLTNRVTATTAEIPAGETDTAETPIEYADLNLTKAVSNGTPNVGDVVTFTLTINNTGNADASGVEVTDVVPNGYGTVTAVTPGASVSANTITWSGLTVVSGTPRVVEFTAQVLASGDYGNRAEITASASVDPDSDPSSSFDTDDYADLAGDDDESAVVSVNPTAVSDISLTKTVSTTSPNVGDNVVFTLTVNNNGPSIATGVEVTDNLPTGYTYVSDNSGGNYTGGVWTVPAIASASSESIEITASVNATGNYENIAEVTAADNLDPDSTPNNGDVAEDDYATQGTTPNPVSDLSIAKIIDNDTPAVGSTVTFTLTLQNDGPSDATGIAIEDVVPSGYDNVVAVTPGATVVGNTISWSGIALANGDNAAFEFTARVLASGNYGNRAQIIASDNLDPNSDPASGYATDDLGDGIEDNDESNTVDVNPTAVSDIEISKTVNVANPWVGSNVVFTITVVNNGLSDATGVEVTDNLPTGYTYVSDNSGGNYTSGVWTVPTIASGSSRSIQITATVNPTGNYTNTVEVTASDNADPDSTPNNGDIAEDDYASIGTNPIAVSDISLLKAVSNDTPFVGDVVTFSLTVTNDGPSEATGVAIEDVVPAGYDNITAITAGSTIVGNTISWSGITIPSGADRVFEFTAHVLATGPYDNAAEVIASDNVDPNSDPAASFGTDDLADGLADNDEASIEVDPVPVSDISLVKTVNDLNPTTGETVTFSLTIHNDGPSDATGIDVTDIVPDGYGAIAAISNGGSVTGNTITWNNLAVVNGADLVLTFTAEVLTTGTNTTTSYYNRAEITGADNVDPDSNFTQSFDTDDLGDGLADDDESIEDQIVINFLPTAQDDAAVVVENSVDNALTILLDNGNGADDFGRDGPSSGTIVLATNPAHGSAIVNDNGTANDPTDDYIVYTPDADYVGLDSFTYTIEDSNGDMSTATVSIEVLVDTDGDGVPDLYDIDDDNDGIIDTAEGNGLDDSDNDGIVDSLDIDADNDGIPDNVEAQPTDSYVAPSGIDVDGNGLDDIYENNPGDGGGITPVNTDGTDLPDFLDTDSDNDNVPDRIEGNDANHDGIADVTLLNSDEDQDGLDDGYEGADTNDGFDVNDEIDNPADDMPDTDGTEDADYRDEDDDGDGVWTYDEDLNGNGDPFDDDTDNDLQPNYLDVDDDGDGILTVVEGTDNSDSDAYPDYLDIDADGDGIPDNVEAQPTVGYIEPSGIDADGNGLDDAYGEDGVIPVNTDGVDYPDYLDDDSDNDGVHDYIEGHDLNHDGHPDVEEIGVDSDGDGLDDGYEGSNVNDIDANDEIDDPSNDLPNFDATGDPLTTDDLDYRDIDDDNDGDLTADEDANENGIWYDDDCDADGKPNYLDVTSCNIIPNAFSPNGDGDNDTFIIPLLSKYPNFNLEIFDRWGQKVHEYRNNGKGLPDWWDGYSTGKMTMDEEEKVPVGTYYYIIYFNEPGVDPVAGWVYVNY